MTYASKIEDLIAERDELRAELESLRRDAARYRFLRAVDHIGISPQAARDPVAYDAAIDAAMTGETR